MFTRTHLLFSKPRFTLMEHFLLHIAVLNLICFLAYAPIREPFLWLCLL
jgi:hypothetical protein